MTGERDSSNLLAVKNTTLLARLLLNAEKKNTESMNAV